MKKRVINLTLFIATVLIGMNSCTNRKASVTEDVYNISSQDTAVWTLCKKAEQKPHWK